MSHPRECRRETGQGIVNLNGRAAAPVGFVADVGCAAERVTCGQGRPVYDDAVGRRGSSGMSIEAYVVTRDVQGARAGPRGLVQLVGVHGARIGCGQDVPVSDPGVRG